MTLSSELDVAIVLCGPSQVGKSTIINQFVHTQTATVAVGNGNGESVTSQVHTHQTKIGLVQEIPGYNDSKLSVDNGEMAKQSAAQLAIHGVDAVRFVICESLAGDTVQIRHSILELCKQHGEKVVDSVLVVCTKVDRAYELSQRIETIQSIMKELNIGQNDIVIRKNDEEPEFEDKLLKALSNIKPIATAELQDINTRIEERAKRLCDEQIPETYHETCRVDETYAEAYEVKVPYEVENRTETRENNMDKAIRRDGVGAVVIKSIITAGIYPVIMGNQVETLVEITKETKYKSETKFRTSTRNVEKKVQKKRMKKVGDFVNRARKEILDDISTSMNRG